MIGDKVVFYVVVALTTLWMAFEMGRDVPRTDDLAIVECRR